jgi:hypothetical protein
MEKEAKKELVSKLLDAANKLGKIKSADHLVVHEDRINQICEEYKVSRDEALLIIQEIMNSKQ